jgi:hypothetical protein
MGGGRGQGREYFEWEDFGLYTHVVSISGHFVLEME